MRTFLSGGAGRDAGTSGLHERLRPMCYGDDARPPAPPVRGEVGDHGDLILTSADGTKFAAYHAHPAGGSDRAIVILPDVRGLHPFYKELAVSFAEAGYHAVAYDYFGRTAGLTG